jgi:hypothetical protein
MDFCAVRLIAEVAYPRTEIGFLREQIPKERTLRFTDAWQYGKERR